MVFHAQAGLAAGILAGFLAAGWAASHGPSEPATKPASTGHSAPVAQRAFRFRLAQSAPATRPARPAQPIALDPGPHLLLDDLLVQSRQGLTRKVTPPKRDPALPNPLVKGGEDESNVAPFLSVLKDPTANTLRLWYRVAGKTAYYMESEDGIQWKRPPRALPSLPGGWPLSVIDEGPAWPDKATRFKLGHHGNIEEAGLRAVGMRFMASADGLEWKPLPHTPIPHRNDVSSLFYDPLRRRYVATFNDRIHPKLSGRMTLQRTSKDLVQWSPPFYVLLRDAEGGDPKGLEFYSMDGFLVRGGLILGMAKALQDSGEKVFPDEHGLGYTQLTWTRDGETWFREPEPFFDRAPAAGAFDHAMAWIDEQVPMGEEVYLYYGAYARGHKNFKDRTLGLVKMQRDRYVAWEAGADGGRFLTPPVILNGQALTLNVQAAGGEVRVQVLDGEERVLPGFSRQACQPIAADALDAPVDWGRPLSELKGRTVRLEVFLKNARLFAFGVR